VSPYNFRASGSILTKFFPGHVPRGRGDKMGITFGRPAPWNLAGRIKRPKFGAISDNFRLWSRISPERIDTLHFINQSPFHVGRKNTWTLVHKQKSYMGSYWPTKADILWETTFRPLGLLPPQIFTRDTYSSRLASAHYNCTDGAPLKNLILKI